MNTSEKKLTLHQFWFSHYNEKARWALDSAGLAYESVVHSPGLHFGPIQKISRQVKTPVLVVHDSAGVSSRTVIAGSDKILEFAADTRPERNLLPRDAAGRAEVLALCARFDRDVGAPQRRSLFQHIIEHDRGAIAEIFTIGKSTARRLLYAAAVPALCVILRKNDMINAETAREGEANVSETLDFLAERTRATGYLYGDSFTLADLTAAALLLATALPPELPFTIPPRAVKLLTAWNARWQGHPGVEYIRAMFRKHRK